MSEQSKLIDPAGRCVHAKMERIVSGVTHTYTNEWRCADCRKEYFDIDLPADCLVIDLKGSAFTIQVLHQAIVLLASGRAVTLCNGATQEPTSAILEFTSKLDRKVNLANEDKEWLQEMVRLEVWALKD